MQYWSVETMKFVVNGLSADFAMASRSACRSRAAYQAAESLEIQFLSGIDHAVGAHEARDEHFVEAVPARPPEAWYALGRAERVDGAVFALTPLAEPARALSE